MHKNRSANLGVIRELYRAFKERDDAAFQAICDENIEWRQNPGFPNGRIYIGAEAVIENVFKSFDQTWHAWTFEIEQFYDAGEAVIVTGRYKGQHKQTGKYFVSEAAHIYTLKGRKVIKFQQYADSKRIWDAMA